MNRQKQLILQIETTQKILKQQKDELSAHKKYLKQIINENQLLLELLLPITIVIGWRLNVLNYLGKWAVKAWEISLLCQKL